jgi:hypothetical protein
MIVSFFLVLYKLFPIAPEVIQAIGFRFLHLRRLLMAFQNQYVSENSITPGLLRESMKTM